MKTIAKPKIIKKPKPLAKPKAPKKSASVEVWAKHNGRVKAVKDRNQMRYDDVNRRNKERQEAYQKAIKLQAENEAKKKKIIKDIEGLGVLPVDRKVSAKSKKTTAKKKPAAKKKATKKATRKVSKKRTSIRR